VILPRDSLTPEELLAILKVARDRRIRDWCMILMAYWHGLRMSEVCALKLTDIRGGRLSLQRRQGSLKTVQPLCRDSEPLLDEVAAIQVWLKQRPRIRSGVLFISQKGGGLHKTQFFRNFQAVAYAAGLPADKSNPGILRHSLAAHLMARDADPALVAKALGHRSVTNTLQFVKAIDRRVGNADPSAAVMQETRRKIVRLLVQHAPKSLPAGAIARRLHLRGPNLSFHLNVLASAKLIQSHRKGTSISYSANPENVNRLVNSRNTRSS
jgi:type 1 fimbriae regulatory protein FimB